MEILVGFVWLAIIYHSITFIHFMHGRLINLVFSCNFLSPLL